MKGVVILWDGTKVALPVLTSWKTIHTDGTSSDSFFVTFCYDSQWETILRQAVRFEAWEGTTQRFYGIVDEYEVRWDNQGLVAEIYGRGLAGLLMDNQVAEGEYYWISLRDMVKKYVEPYEIPAIQYEANPVLTSYAVDYGTDCWRAFQDFCLWALEIQPRFLPDGTLLITSEPGQRRRLEPGMGEKYVWRQTRYGVYSQVVAKYVGTLYEDRISNTEFGAMGGCATCRMTIPRKNRCRAGLSSPKQVMEQSKKSFRILEVTVPELFWAEPLDEVELTLPEMGISGVFQVVETENSVDQSGGICRISLRIRE